MPAPAGFFYGMKNTIVTLLSDFGTRDHYTAAMKGSILSIAPGTTLVDVTHQVPPQNVEAAAYLLEQYWNDFPEGTIHLCVVDPDVGGARNPVAAAKDGRIYVGPDNGIITNLLHKDHRWKARILDNEKFHRQPVSSTFHGRDIFAPVAGHLARGAGFEELGTPVKELVLLDTKPVIMGTSIVQGKIIYIDSFGNLITNIRREHLQWGQLDPAKCGLKAAGQMIGNYVRHYAQSRGEPCFLFGSGGYLEIAVRNGSAAEELALGAGTDITVMPIDTLLSI